QVLGDLTPADAAVNLDEVAATVDLGTQGATAFQLAVDLPFQVLDFDEGVLVAPEGFKGFSENQLHAASLQEPACWRCACAVRIASKLAPTKAFMGPPPELHPHPSAASIRDR